MTYEAFKIAMTAEVANMVGEEVDVCLHKIPKNNGIIMDAMTVMPHGGHIAPTIYLKDYFTRFEKGESMEAIARDIINISLDNPIGRIVPKDFFLKYESVKSRICFKLINYEKNKELLSELPHKCFLDLAMVFYYAIDPGILGHATVLVRKTDMERWNITVDELVISAMINTPQILPWRFASIHHVVDELLFEGPDQALEVIGGAREIVCDDSEIVPMYILTNQEKYFGAACILYPELLSVIAERFNSDLYILPSSIHECIIMPVSGLYTQESLSQMVYEINKREVEDVEILSDHAYFYNRELNEIHI